MKTEDWGGARVEGRAHGKGVWNTVGMFRTVDFATRHTEADLLQDGFFNAFAHEIGVLDRIRYHCWNETDRTWIFGVAVVTGNTWAKTPAQGHVTVRKMEAAEIGLEGEVMAYHAGFGKFDVVKGVKLAEGVDKEQAAVLAGAAT